MKTLIWEGLLFGLFQNGVSKAVQVLLDGIEAVLVYIDFDNSEPCHMESKA